ncbi:MAG TPA: M28 family metallopeptidase [Nitrososphaeraceae archaeon]|nr:M28 family metallopeptidase [Nitrososphaeraceae archaeon]
MCKNFKIDKRTGDMKTITIDMQKSEIKLDNDIGSLLDQLSLDNIKTKLNYLSSFHNRHSKSRQINKAADWLLDEFKNIGYHDVYFDNYKAYIDNCNYNLKNVICTKEGNDNKYILICAHYDTILKVNLEDAISRAPGANDNASGVSAILEIARILYNQPQMEYGIQFVLFSGEERGLLGSEHYAQYVKENGIQIFRLINLDMIGNPFLGAGIVVVEVDNYDDKDDKCRYNKVKQNDNDSIECGNLMVKMSMYTDLQPPLLKHIYGSDYEHFEAKGHVVIGAYDGSAEDENPHYHSATDTPDLINWIYLTSVTKMVLATIATLQKEHH